MRERKSESFGYTYGGHADSIGEYHTYDFGRGFPYHHGNGFSGTAYNHTAAVGKLGKCDILVL
ncbi:MAG: hypothetical protein J6S79_09775 [Lachnospiraceae bacterium]|nr:hypothetical protein [Lachnospiraceae bacterium]